MENPVNILIVDDNLMMTKTLRDIFVVKGFNVEVANSGAEALKKIDDQTFACILSDIRMPEINGVELFRAIKEKQPDVPVVLMTAYSNDKLIQEGMDEGILGVLTKPLNLNLLLDFMVSLGREQSIIIVDDDPDFCRTLGDILQSYDYKVTNIVDPQLLNPHLEAKGEIVLLDMKFEEITGLDLLKDIKGQYPDLSVILVTAYGDELFSEIESGIQMSAYTCLFKPIQIDKLIESLKQIRQIELSRMLLNQAG